VFATRGGTTTAVRDHQTARHEKKTSAFPSSDVVFSHQRDQT
jgi:hypothetical protein